MCGLFQDDNTSQNITRVYVKLHKPRKDLIISIYSVKCHV